MTETNNARVYDMLIVGGGLGGYTAALYAARAGLSVLVLEKRAAGGQMALTEQIDNYPGFAEGIGGFRLGENMRLGAERFGAERVFTEVLSLTLRGEEKRAHTTAGDYRGKTVVIATGADPRTLDLPGESRLLGHGIHYCAACDGRFYKDKAVCVIGGGNSAAEDALLLSRLCKTVYLVHRRDALRADKIAQDALQQAKNIKFRLCSEAVGLLGDETLTGVMLKNTQSGEKAQLVCDGVFVSIGRVPASKLVSSQLACDAQGYLLAGESTRTRIAGVFAVGDVRAKPLRQIVTATADGAVAAHYAQAYLANGEWI